MNVRYVMNRAWFGAIAAALVLAGCQMSKPAPATQPSADAGGAPAIPAASFHRAMTLAELTGGDLGIGGGFLVGAAPEKLTQHAHAQAVAASQHAEESPAELLTVRNTTSADLNGDGFITLDEILAMARAGLSDREISDRLRQSGYIFQITPEQGRYLTDRGVDQSVVSTLKSLSESRQGVKS